MQQPQLQAGKPIVKPRTWNATDTYIAYATELLAENPEYWSKYSKARGMRHFWVYTMVNNKIVEVINFDRWKAIMKAYFLTARECIINGEQLNMGNYIGRIAARRVERNHSNPRINFHATSKRPKVMNDKGQMVPDCIVYFTDDDWVRVGWFKTNKIPNETVYQFAPSNGDDKVVGFKEQFSAANKLNPGLKLTYRFFPYLSKNKRNGLSAH
jgi:hypothetical protein